MNAEINGKIAVLGGTGKTGRRVAALLRADGHEVRVASRSGEVRFDWQDRGTWPAVTDGVAALFLVAPDDPDLVQPFVDLAQEAGLARLVLLSGRGGDEVWRGRFGHSMAVAEDVVRRSGLSWAVVRSDNFMQNFTEDLFHAPLLAGRLALPIGEMPDAFVDLDDVAAVVARLLATDGRRPGADGPDGRRPGADGPAGRIYELAGPTAVTFAEAVAAISSAAGRPIRYEEISPDAYAHELRAAGLGEEWVADLSGLFEIMREGHLSTPTDDVEQVLGRPPRSFAEWVARTAPTGVWGS